MKRTFFLIILIFSFTAASALAQTADKILAQGNPALTQTMVDKSREVFEFAFGGALSESEKQTFQEHIVKQWKNNDAETIKAIQDFVGFYDKAAGLSKEKLIDVQKQLRELVVKDLRSQTSSDPLAKMLIGAFDRIQGLNAKQGGDVPVPQDVQQQQTNNQILAGSGGAVPQELLGEWVESHSSGSTYTNNYGNYSAPSGEKIILHFYADGTYKGAYFVQSSMSVACTMTVFMPSSGTFSVSGNTLNLKEQSNRTISKDTCVARYNYEKDNKPGVYAYPAQIVRDEYGTKLVLTMSDGSHNFYFNTGQSLLGGK